MSQYTVDLAAITDRFVTRERDGLKLACLTRDGVAFDLEMPTAYLPFVIRALVRTLDEAHNHHTSPTLPIGAAATSPPDFVVGGIQAMTLPDGSVDLLIQPIDESPFRLFLTPRVSKELHDLLFETLPLPEN